MTAGHDPGGGGAWHLLTGEYPPRAGGVSDYSAVVARGLAAHGAEVHVWTGPAEGAAPEASDSGVSVHRTERAWSPGGLGTLAGRLDRFPPPRSILVQYTPNAWGYKGVNLGFVRWLRRRSRSGDRVEVMVHEAAYPWRLRDKPTRLVVATLHRAMLHVLLRSCAQLDYSSERVGNQVRARAPRELAMRWLPVPSNVPVVEDSAGVAALRQALAPGGESLVGFFGTFGSELRSSLRKSLPGLLQDRPGRVLVLIGRNGPAFAESLVGDHPDLAGRVRATGGLDPEDLSRHLQACDLMVQPYPDGVSTRRTTAMAALAHGRPVAANLGCNTEGLWAEGGVALAGDLGPALAGEVDRLLADPEARVRLGAEGLALYDRRFALARTIAALLGAETETEEPACART